MPIRGILFDKDGTLIDFNRTWLPIYKKIHKCIARQLSNPALEDQLLEKGGWDFQASDWKPDSVLAAGSNHQILNFWQTTTGTIFDSALLSEIQNILAKDHKQISPAIPDLDQYFDLLHRKHYKLGVATMDDSSSARSTLEQLGVMKYLDFVCGADSGFGVKPEPGMINAFCTQCDLEPAEVAMVGDSPRDLLMGQHAKAGLSIGVLTGTSGQKDLQPYADHVIQDIGFILQIIESQPNTN